jgi:hypothetical protein
MRDIELALQASRLCFLSFLGVKWATTALMSAHQTRPHVAKFNLYVQILLQLFASAMLRLLRSPVQRHGAYFYRLLPTRCVALVAGLYRNLAGSKIDVSVYRKSRNRRKRLITPVLFLYEIVWNRLCRSVRQR